MGLLCCSGNPQRVYEYDIVGKESIIFDHQTLTCTWPSKYITKRLRPDHKLHILHDYQVNFLRKLGISKSWTNITIRDTGNICSLLGSQLYKFINVRNLKIILEQTSIEKTKEKGLLKKLVSRNRLKSYEIFANSVYSRDIPLKEISKQSSLENLSLSLYNISATSTKDKVTIPVRRCNKLKKIKLCLHQIQAIDTKTFATLFYRIGQLNQLQSVSFYVSLDHGLVKRRAVSESYKLLSRLEKLEKLETIIFYDDDEDEAQINSLCYLVSSLPQIQSLNIKILNDDLIDVKIPISYPMLINTISTLKKLKNLDLTINNLLEPKHSINYAYTITTVEKTCSFTLVVHPDSEKGENTHKNIFLPLSNLKTLEKLNWSCSIPMHGIMRSLTDSIANHTKLSTLRLYSNDNSENITKEDTEKIYKNLKSLRNLKSLDLESFNCANQDVAIKVLSGITELSLLTHLTLRAEDIMSVTKRKNLYQTLRKLKNLETLELNFYDSQVSENPLSFIEVINTLKKLDTLKIDMQYFDAYIESFLRDLGSSLSTSLNMGFTLRLANSELNYLKKIGILLLRFNKIVQLKIDIAFNDSIDQNSWDEINSITFAISKLTHLEELDFRLTLGDGELSTSIEYLNQCFPNLQYLKSLRIELCGDVKTKNKSSKVALLQRICPMMHLKEIFIKLNKEILIQFRNEHF